MLKTTRLCKTLTGFLMLSALIIWQLAISTPRHLKSRENVFLGCVTEHCLGIKYNSKMTSHNIIHKYNNTIKKALKNKSYKADACFQAAYGLADELYKRKSYEDALILYKTIADYPEYADSAQISYNIAYQYINGLGTKIDNTMAIYWYSKALQKFEKLPTRVIKQDTSIIASICNDLGVANNNLRNYVDAFKFFQLGATMHDSLSQLNLAKMYFNGKGTIQNYKQAFAWASVAAAKGLDNTTHQKDAEQLRDSSESILSRQSKTDLKQAKSLAQTYYNKYVLNKAN